MKHIAAEQYQSVVRKLAVEIKRDERSLRAICAETSALDAPERMRHPKLSVTLRMHDNRNLYLQQFLVLCKLLGINPLAFLVPTDDMDVARPIAKAAAQLVKVSGAERRRLLDLIEQAAMNAHRPAVTQPPGSAT